MSPEELHEILLIGETVSTEFKRCGNQPGKDVFETICSFCNRFGGDIFLGVDDNGAITGVTPEAIPAIKRNIINIVNNPNVFSPPATLEFGTITCENTPVLRIWIPASPSVHSFKGVVYDRREDADVALHHEANIATLFLRKQNIYSEQRVFRYLTVDELHMEKLDFIRKRAAAKRPDHPWIGMGDREILESMQLYSRDYGTGEEGFTLAAGLLLGRDEVIASICPAYKTDAILQREDLDRYDDRLTVRTNLIDAYERLTGFCRKHLPDRFHLEGDQAVSPRDIIVRELVSNLLMHREFTSPIPAKIVIEQDALRTENASRAMFQGPIDPNDFNPFPKNPIIGRFFSQIGLAEEMGSGTHNLFKFARIYAGEPPDLEEGDIFKASVPLRSKAERAFGSTGNWREIALSEQTESEACAPSAERIEYCIVSLAAEKGSVSAAEVSKATGARPRNVQRALAKMAEKGALRAFGNTRAKRYYPIEQGDGDT